MDIEGKKVLPSSETLPTQDDNSYKNNQSKQRIIFGIGVNGLIIGGAIINANVFKYIFENKNDIAANFYISLIFPILIVYTYLKASWTSPAQTDVDQYFNVNVETINKFGQKAIPLVNLDIKQFTKCEFCRKIKFERSSHCRVCKICVLRRDHHCVWIGNCVGNGNNQFFFNFCLWVVVNYL